MTDPRATYVWTDQLDDEAPPTEVEVVLDEAGVGVRPRWDRADLGHQPLVWVELAEGNVRVLINYGQEVTEEPIVVWEAAKHARPDDSGGVQ